MDALECPGGRTHSHLSAGHRIGPDGAGGSWRASGLMPISHLPRKTMSHGLPYRMAAVRRTRINAGGTLYASSTRIPGRPSAAGPRCATLG
jgi:hypothetical protein